MKPDDQRGFTLIELMIATAILLLLLSAALTFFSRSQVIYTNERVTLDMVQDLRTVFDRFTNEIRMAGAGLPGDRGVISGSATSLVVRGDYDYITTSVSSANAVSVSGSTATFSVGTTDRFAAGQTVSLLNNLTGASALVKITAINAAAKTISVNAADLLPVTAGVAITSNPGTNSFPAGTIIDVIQRRTYSIITSGSDLGAITCTVAYEDTQTAGATVLAAEIIARNVIDPNGNPGLAFTYLKADGGAADIDPSGNVTPSQVVKVQIRLQARSANRDLASGNYRTLNYTALVQVRGQYIPAVGF